MLLNDFITSQGHNCILGNVYNAMNYFHVDIPEQNLFFWFSPFDGDRNLPEVFEKLYEDKGECDWLEFLQKSLKSGQPVIVSINPKTLPYIKVEVGDSSTKHYINIIGIDVGRKQLYVSDSYIPTYIPLTYEGWVDYSEISDSDIGNCWHLKSELIFYFQNKCGTDDINSFTMASIIKRLNCFLNENNDNQHPSGIEDLQMLSKIVRNDLEAGNNDEIFKLLAGIRLNIINPLIYLVDVFERCSDEYSEWIKSLNNLVIDHWETLNMKLIKFALAHKKLDVDKVSKQIDKAVKLEKDVLNDILEQLLKTESNSNVEHWNRCFFG